MRNTIKALLYFKTLNKLPKVQNVITNFHICLDICLQTINIGTEGRKF